MQPQQHIIKLAQPHSEKQRVIMQALITPGVREIWVPCGTKFGKTFAAASAVCARAPFSPGGLIRWIAPIYSQSKIGFNYIRRMMPGEPLVKINKAELSIHFNPTDTSIEIKSGRNPEDLEGEATSANVLDEVAKMTRQVYDSTKTTTTVTRGPILAISTPRGKNWFYTKCMEARERMQWDLRRGKPPTILYITAPSTDNPLVSAEAVEDARRGLPDRLFRQYYQAEFIDDGSVFAGYRDCIAGEAIETIDKSQRWFLPGYDTTKGQVVIGADWAKTKDWTVFVAIDVPTRRIVAFQRFHKTPYTEAVGRLIRFSKQFADVIVINHDKTGLGGVIDDLLANSDIPYNGITFTNSFKAEEVAKLITAFEQKLLTIPNWSHLLDELECYEVKATPTGNMTYAAAEGKHDDIVSALMLAYSALSQYADAVYDVRFVEGNKIVDAYGSEVKDTQSPIERYYQDIVGMSDDD
jgi:hypothetical protein